MLRFFDGRKLSEVGAALETGEEAARKRVNAEVEKLRRYFTRRGVVLSAPGLTAVIGANSVQAAPAGLAAASVTAAAGKGVVSGGSMLALIKVTLNKMLWMKLKTSIASGTAVLLAAGIATVVVGKVHSSSLIEDAFRNTDVQSMEKAPAMLVLRPTQYPGFSSEAQSGERQVNRNMALEWLAAFAYDYEW